MTADRPSSYELRLERTLDAPIDRVWGALTNANRIAEWYGPGGDFQIEVLEWDCHVGGKYRVAMHRKDGPTHVCFGVFKDLEPPQRLAYTWDWEGQPVMDTVVTFVLTAEGSRTRLEFIHAGFPTEDTREQHRMGWTGSLERLAGMLA